MSRLRAMKRYFLLDSADFLVQFLDLASDELFKRAADVSPTKLQNLWDLCTGGKTDAFRVEVSSKSFLESIMRMIAHNDLDPKMAGAELLLDRKTDGQKKIDPGVIVGFDGFSLGYLTQFPVSIIFNYQSVLMYKTLFRHLFNCKHVERQLASGWQSQSHRKWFSPSSSTTSASYPDLAAFENKLGVLRNQMLNALRQVMLYMCLDVIERKFKIMESKVGNARTVMNVIDAHVDFLTESCKECMITEMPVIMVSLEMRAVSGLRRALRSSLTIYFLSQAFSRVMFVMSTFSAFSNWVSTQMQMLESGASDSASEFLESTYSLPDQLQSAFAQAEQEQLGASSSTPQSALDTLMTLFYASVDDLIDAIKEATEGCPQLAKLAQRLDYDGYWTSRREAARGNVVEGGGADEDEMEDM